MRMYNSLCLQNVKKVAKCLSNYTDIIHNLAVVDSHVTLPLMSLYNAIPVEWIGLLNGDFETETCHLVECCFATLMTPKAFTQSLIPQNLYPRGTAAWATDLGMTIELPDWYNICRKVSNIPSPKLQDFHLQFLNRGYCLNVLLAILRMLIDTVHYVVERMKHTCISSGIVQK